MKGCNISEKINNDICESFKSVFASNFCDFWSNGWACFKLNDLMGKVKAELIEAESTIIDYNNVT